MPADPFNLLFWHDFETSGLEIGRDRILEAAWFFTDENLRLLTPVRQRLACIEPVGARTDFDGNLFDSSRSSDWITAEFFDQRGRTPGFVQQMHGDSGLTHDHLIVAPEMVLTDAKHFERMFLDDLFSAKEASGGEADYQVVLAGAGVSHMDVHMLADLLPRRFPLHPSPNGSSGMAYWHYDVSTATRCLPPATMDRAREWLRDPEVPFDLLACESGTGDEWNESGLIKLTGSEPRQAEFDIFGGGVVRHRAASDVIESLIDARLIRRLDQVPGLLTSRDEVG
jgi:hypothetical protein